MSVRLVLAAGGTGGHVFPAQSLCEALLKQGTEVVFITDSRSTRYLKGALADIPHHVLHSGTLGKGLKGKVFGVINLMRGLCEALVVLRKIKPSCVVGFGGYPSFPAVFAAQLLGIKTVLHEQNAVLGLANRLLAKRAHTLALSVENTTRIPKTRANIIITGNPVRAEIAALHKNSYSPPTENFNVLVTGGSQGASIFSTLVPGAVAQLPQRLKSILHIT